MEGYDCEQEDGGDRFHVAHLDLVYRPNSQTYRNIVNVYYLRVLLLHDRGFREEEREKRDGFQ
jgi:hypothetical protein